MDGCVVLGRREEVGPLAPVVVAVVVVYEHRQVPGHLTVGSEATDVAKRPVGTIARGHAASRPRVIRTVDVQPHDELSSPGVVHDLRTLGDVVAVQIVVGIARRGQDVAPIFPIQEVARRVARYADEVDPRSSPVGVRRGEVRRAGFDLAVPVVRAAVE